jgi:hypothetical protein
MSAKRRTDAFDAVLTDEQRWALFDQGKRLPWYGAAAWAHKELGIDPPGKTAFYDFMAYMRSEDSERRIAQALAAKNDMGRAMREIGDMDPELAHAWQQMALESALNGDPDAARRYLDMAMELRKSALEGEKLRLKQEAEIRARQSLELEREKFADLQRRNDAAKAKLEQVKAKGGIDEETLRKIEEAVGLL